MLASVGATYVIQVMVIAMLMLPMTIVMLWLLSELLERTMSWLGKLYRKMERAINSW